ncbi:tripartite tricarboxylate transporter substrate binding protein [Roseomonas sp. JC162]|uniref:Tripartite tricarboxylate transporter substrate binding protein n=1 Tax=Neoroseomonas marina TaxID=1232220 RepID=A0A848EHK9_9PROT|nr:tripartite tricarboxylate transporter substrate binding protein [Neoroseomonas marina]NMJ42915.1 tripartite tricarboxylate transporter substrate binding protein [Neoroseomonas marina]
MVRTIAAALCLLASAATAQEAYPSRTITLIAAYPPGGNTDLMARAIQPELSRALGQTVVVVNRGGAAGTIGSAELARARPDGYTIGITPNNPITAQPHAIPLTYSLDSFRFLCRVYDNPQVVILGRNAPFQDFRGMIAHGRSAREALVYGAPGSASTQHILMAALLKRASVEGLMVSFTGAGPMSQAALGGQIMAFIEASSIPASTGLTPIAVVTAQRLPHLPDVPTVGELGYPVQGSSHGGLIAPAGIPDAAAAAIERACETAVASEGFRTTAQRLASVPAFLPGDRFRETFAAESAANQTLLRDLGLARP